MEKEHDYGDDYGECDGDSWWRESYPSRPTPLITVSNMLRHFALSLA
jgi:hypothetical protein